MHVIIIIIITDEANFIHYSVKSFPHTYNYYYYYYYYYYVVV
jgi:hypothetical protein